MACEIKYNDVQPLKRIVLTKIAILFWKPADFQNRDLKNFIQFNSVCNEIEHKAKQGIQHFKLPKLLEEAVVCFVKKIGFQLKALVKWIRKYGENIPISNILADDFHWTQGGTINKKKVAETLVMNEELPANCRYTLACIHCLEKDIAVLWNKIGAYQRTTVFDSSSSEPLTIFWSYCIREGINQMTKFKMLGSTIFRSDYNNSYSSYHFAFHLSAESGNMAATQYFWEKMTPEEKSESLVKTAGDVVKKRWSKLHQFLIDFKKDQYADVLCFLLSQMDENEQIDVYKSNPLEVLACLTDWPWEHFLTETLNRMWNFLPKDTCNDLLLYIANDLISDCENCVYKQLFTEVWYQTPPSFKKYVVNMCMREELVPLLLKSRDFKNIKLIFEEATQKEKFDIFCCTVDGNACDCLIDADEWGLLGSFIEECCSVQENNIAEFKQRLNNSNLRYYANCQGKSEKFLEMVSSLFKESAEKSPKRLKTQ